MKKSIGIIVCCIMIITSACSYRIDHDKDEERISAEIQESISQQSESTDASSSDHPFSQGSAQLSSDTADPLINPTSSSQAQPSSTSKDVDYGDILDSLTGHLNRVLELDDNFGGAYYDSHLENAICIWTKDKEKTKDQIEAEIKKLDNSNTQVEYRSADYSIKQLTSILDDINSRGNGNNQLQAGLAYEKNRVWAYVDVLSVEFETYIAEKDYTDAIVLDRGDVDNYAS